MVTKLDSKIKAVTMRAVAISVMLCVTSGAFTMSPLSPESIYKALNVKYSNEYYGHPITLVLAYTNHAVNFLLYSFFGTDLRRDCADLFRKKPSTVHPECASRQQMPKSAVLTSRSKRANRSATPGLSRKIK